MLGSRLPLSPLIFDKRIYLCRGVRTGMPQKRIITKGVDGRATRSAASGEPYGFLNVGDDLGATLLGDFENDPRLLLVAEDIVAFEQHALEGMINAGRLVNGLVGGRVAPNSTPQSVIVTRRDLNE